MKKKICQWVRLGHGISTLCGKETQFYGEDMKFCPFCGNRLIYKTMPKTLGEIRGEMKLISALSLGRVVERKPK